VAQTATVLDVRRSMPTFWVIINLYDRCTSRPPSPLSATPQSQFRLISRVSLAPKKISYITYCVCHCKSVIFSFRNYLKTHCFQSTFSTHYSDHVTNAYIYSQPSLLCKPLTQSNKPHCCQYRDYVK